MPTSLEIIGYDNRKTITGNSGSRFRCVCDRADVAYYQSYFLRALDGNDLTLKCDSVEWDYLNKDPATAKVELTANFVPGWKLDALVPNSAFKVRIEFGSESFTVSGSAWKWNSGEPITNANILPIKTVGVQQVTLFGTRSSVNLATYSGYQDKVNSDSFLGLSAGKVLFRGAAANPRQLEDGTITYDVEIRLSAREVSWNSFFNETTGAWEDIKDGSSNKLYSATAFGGLLS